jgi:adenosylhomocysteine nucleosidase
MSSDNELRSMKILVVAALQREIAPLARKRLADLECLVTGEGRANAEGALRNWFARNRADAVIGAGLAGALSSTLQIGDLLIDKDSELAASLAELGDAPAKGFPAFRFGKIITVDEILNAAGKGRLAAALDAAEPACVEMESQAIASVCLEKKVPFLLIRAISDLRDEDFPIDFNACRTLDGRVSAAKVLQSVLRKPQAIKGLLRLNRRANLCADRLAFLIEQVILLLPERLAKAGR